MNCPGYTDIASELERIRWRTQVCTAPVKKILLKKWCSSAIANISIHKTPTPRKTLDRSVKLVRWKTKHWQIQTGAVGARYQGSKLFRFNVHFFQWLRRKSANVILLNSSSNSCASTRTAHLPGNPGSVTAVNNR